MEQIWIEDNLDNMKRLVDKFNESNDPNVRYAFLAAMMYELGFLSAAIDNQKSICYHNTIMAVMAEIEKDQSEETTDDERT